ncbi:hypothetical protein Poli38472_013346 [Pythium oligandrum]|uniref:Uncharacterized protein n=1 Tax=Pythium oligandrum TaxID=41045 RepID=A0A8K1FFP6_PYTOL|nr:hypothetical protein Poli38472_013346 [Pythium oligandrum]|eukprot:TMW57872.1 hypothetical protein Poli38472_013346 [Pythium oligandrum]
MHGSRGVMRLVRRLRLRHAAQAAWSTRPGSLHVLPASAQVVASSLTQTASFATKKKLTPPSLVISEAFADADDEDDEEEAYEGGGVDEDLNFGYELTEGDEERVAKPMETTPELSTDEQKELAARFRYGMDKKKEWMQRLADEAHWDALLRVVYECYQPLYETHPRLVGMKCALTELYTDAHEVRTRFQPKWYDDQVTKITESEAMSLFAMASRIDIVMAIYHHREHLAETLGSIVVEGEGNVLTNRHVDFTTNLRSFYSWAIGASSSLRDYAQVFRVYENSLERGLFPTAHMTVAYLHALVAKREFDAVDALYQQVQRDDRPTNLFFYREMLFYARVMQRGALMEQILEEMKIKGFKLRAEDFLNAMRSLDGKYFFTKSANDKQRGAFRVNLQHESYRQCLKRINDQDGTPKAFAAAERAAERALKLYHEMVEDERLVPHSPLFFPRIMVAAMLLHDYDRVVEYVDAASEQPNTKDFVRVASNALLLKDEFEKAEELVMKAIATAKKPEEFAPVVNLLEYASIYNDPATILRLLDVLDKRRAQASLPNDVRELMLASLCRNADKLEDGELWKVLTTHNRAFPVRTKSYWFSQCVRECFRAGRAKLAMRFVSQRNKKEIPAIPGRIIVFFVDSLVSQDRVNDIEALLKQVELQSLPDKDRVAVCAKVIRTFHANNAQGQFTPLIQQVFDHVRHSPDVPQDIRDIVLQYA